MESGKGKSYLKAYKNIEESPTGYNKVEFDKKKKAKNSIEIANFRILPKEIIETEEGDFIRGKVLLPDNKKKQILLEPAIWNSTQKFAAYFNRFNQTVLSVGNNSVVVPLIKGIVTSYELPIKKGVNFIGYYDGHFVLGHNRVINKDGQVKDPDLVYMPSMYPNSRSPFSFLEKSINLKASSADKYQKLIYDISESIFKINDPYSVVTPLLGFYFSMPFRSRLIDIPEIGLGSFLMISGSQGTGKTSTVRTFNRLFGLDGELSTCNLTPFALTLSSASSNVFPLVLDEYKPSKMSKRKIDTLHNLLRNNSTGNADRKGTIKLNTIEFPSITPIILIGEQSVSGSEAALAERSLPCIFKPILQDNQQYQEYFMKFSNLPLNCFLSRYLKWSLSQNPLEIWNEATQIFNETNKGLTTLAPRVIKTMTLMIFGTQCFQKYFNKYEVETAHQFDIKKSIEVIKESLDINKEGQIKIEVDYFLESLSTLADTKKLEHGIHYYHNEDKDQLYLSLPACYAAYKEYWVGRSDQTDHCLDINSFRRQLRNNYELPNSFMVSGTSDQILWEDGVKKRSYQINLKKAEEYGLDLNGFLGSSLGIEGDDSESDPEKEQKEYENNQFIDFDGDAHNDPEAVNE